MGEWPSQVISFVCSHVCLKICDNQITTGGGGGTVLHNVSSVLGPCPPFATRKPSEVLSLWVWETSMLLSIWDVRTAKERREGVRIIRDVLMYSQYVGGWVTD